MAVAAPAKAETGLLEKTFHAGEQLAQTVVNAERVKAQLNHAVEDAKIEAQRFAKRTRRAAEDLTEETAYRIKHDPFQAVAITFGAGFALGALAGWAISRRGKESC
jgi:ElaB/YqjD/DUF883 family membrane-anchored ribosome-binding protein